MDLNKISINSYILTHPGSLENTIEAFVKGKCLRLYYLDVYLIGKSLEKYALTLFKGSFGQ